MLSLALAFTALVLLAVLAARAGADTRPHDPGCLDRQWPFGHRGS